MPQENENEKQTVNTGIPYVDQMMQEDQLEVTECLRLLLRQTFVLEKKYEKRTGRFAYNKEFRLLSRHLEFIRNYFGVMGIEVIENSHMGIIYIQGENLAGEKLPRLATLYILALKLIYDEQMETASAAGSISTTLGALHEKLGSYRLFKRQPSPTEIRRAITLLKKYQLIEPLELLDDLNFSSRLVIYPCINVVLMGDDIRALFSTFEEEGAEEERENENQLQEEDSDGTDNS
jgi:hypothetical protein